MRLILNEQPDRRFNRSMGLLLIALIWMQLPFPNLLADDSNVSRPNVILVITDDQGYGDVGFHNNPVIQTPNLDQLARQSIRLTDFHVDPTCAETRSALMTGRYSSRVGVWHTIMGRSILRDSERTMADYFKQAGYRTGMFGKWHLGDNYPYRPHERGFEQTLAHGGGGVGQTPDYWGNDYFDDTYFRNGKPEPQKGYCTDVFFSAAMDFVTQHKSEPFFCYVSTNAPHGPYLVDPKYSEPYKQAGCPGNMAPFYGMITNIDENMGKLIAHLDRLKLRDNTLVIFMTDNGTAAGVAGQNSKSRWKGVNAGMRGRKGSQYDGGHRVPCFWSWPNGKLAVNQEVSRISAHLDLLPTLAEICGFDSDKATPWDGQSLAPLLRKPDADWPDRTLFVHSQRIDKPEKWRKCSVMTESWRLVDGKELYKIKADPGQKNNLADEQPAVVTRLRNAYQKWWQSIEPSFAGYAEIPIGDPKAPSVLLTGHDWHPPGGATSAVPWNQRSISRNSGGNGFWAVRIVRSGTYRITLRMRPPSVPFELKTGQAGFEFKTQSEAIGQQSDIQKGTDSVSFELELPVGSAKLTTSIAESGTKAHGAYFVTVERLEKTASKRPLPAEIQDGERVVWLGSGLFERMQQHGFTETWLQSRLVGRKVSFRNLGWSGDDVWGTARAVFGNQRDGFDRLRKDLKDANPNLVILNFGANEASDLGISGEDFRAGLQKLLNVIESLSARAILVTPRAQEDLGPPYPDPTARNAHLGQFCKIIKEEAASRGFASVDLYSHLGGRLTSDGIHVTPFGYWRLAHRLTRALDGSQVPWVVDIDSTKASMEATGCLITDLVKTEHGLQWKLKDQYLSPPPPPAESPYNARWLLDLGTIRIRGLRQGDYELRVDGKPFLRGRFDKFALGFILPYRPDEIRAEQLRKLIVQKNSLHFHRHRPQNETYLFLFRKHEQGNNAKEVFEFDALVNEVDSLIAAQSHSTVHSWELIRIDNLSSEDQAVQPFEKPTVFCQIVGHK